MYHAVCGRVRARCGGVLLCAPEDMYMIRMKNSDACVCVCVCVCIRTDPPDILNPHPKGSSVKSYLQ